MKWGGSFLFLPAPPWWAGSRMRPFFCLPRPSAASTAALVRILIEDYQPRLLIFGTDARDYAVSPMDPDPAVILESAWVQYRQGNFSLEGWLLQHSYFYRYRQHLGRLIHFHLNGTLWSQTDKKSAILPNGFTPLQEIATYINDPPDPKDNSFQVQYLTRIYSSYRMLDDNVVALERIIEYDESDRGVIIVEMPVSDGLYYFFGNGEVDYNTFIARISELADLYHVPVWRTEPLDSTPDDGWSDYSHLNVTGAAIFSTWLGEQVGKLEIQKDAADLKP